jgi:nitroreductase
MLEAGHAAQNLALPAVARELATTVVGAFSDRALRELLGAPPLTTSRCMSSPLGCQPNESLAAGSSPSSDIDVTQHEIDIYNAYRYNMIRDKEFSV